MTTLALAVLVASLVGSPHCMGMCGGFVAFYAGSDPTRGRARALTHVAYNSGRLVVYVALGLAAGSLGAAVDLAGSAAGLQRTAAVIAGSAMIAWGAVTLAAVLGVRMPALPLPARLRRLTTEAFRSLRGRPPLVRAAAMGLLTALLPCGWLYAFVVASAGTASATAGAATMAVFWVGTLPLMLALGLGVQALAGPLRRHLPAASAIALVVVGLLSVAGRIDVASHTAEPHAAASPSDAAAHVRSLDAEDAPCCDHDHP